MLVLVTKVGLLKHNNYMDKEQVLDYLISKNFELGEQGYVPTIEHLIENLKEEIMVDEANRLIINDKAND